MLAVVLMSCTSTAVSPARVNIEFGGQGGCSLIVSLYRLAWQLALPFASQPRESAGRDFGETTVIPMTAVDLVIEITGGRIPE